MNILDQILADKRREIDQRKQSVPLRKMERRALASPSPPDFLAALRSKPIGLIAEVKRRSPSAGLIRTPFDPAEIATEYERGGAQAVSVLMDAPYFGGGEGDFEAVRRVVDLPLLYKEFVVDLWQVFHARAMGASAVLLIVAALEDGDLRELSRCAESLGLVPLVEVHDASELSRASDLGARCIGINNRDLKTFHTTLETTEELSGLAPAGCCLVSESGIGSAEDVERVRRAGAHAVLVGESLLRRPRLAEAIQDLMGRAWASG
ncbi:MAG: indole-3-glycerol phosphate synthase TrpC [Kiritimatiellae bacterium]|nr:indole-3-glycerol phosphate synthase TrpC [Kiritimatiellia bacterium]MDW8458987.1 indole-3-glycerol phosphate synthase TrpC [Verrucomicrobiota bacterium]